MSNPLVRYSDNLYRLTNSGHVINVRNHHLTGQISDNYYAVPSEKIDDIEIVRYDYLTLRYTWYIKEFYLHRVDGPAYFVERNNEIERIEFWLYGKRYYSTEEYFEALTLEQKEKAIWNLDEIRER